MSTIKLPAASGGGSISLKGPSTLGTDRDLVDTSGNINLLDSQKLNVGTDDDLQLFHDGSSSYIRNTTGPFYIEAKSGETAIQIVPDGATDLRYDGTKKLETLTDGVRVTDYLKFTGANCGIDFGSTSNAGGMTSEVLDDYEEGTWTPAAVTGTCSSGYATYTKIGNMVTLHFDVNNFSNSSSSNEILLTGLPYAGISSQESGGACHGERLDTTLLVSYISNVTKVGFRGGIGSSNYSYILHSQINDGADSNIKSVLTYMTS